MIRKVSLKLKFTLMIILMLTIMVAGILISVRISISTEAEKAAVKKAKTDLMTGYEVLDLTHPGEWRLDGGQLYKGDVLMNGNYQIVDQIGELTNDTVTIFAGKTRIATNVMVDGQRAVGTMVSQEVAEIVLQDGEDFYGEANVVGNIYQTAYTPLKNEEGKIIGIWYVGTDKGFVREMIVNAFRSITIVGVLVLIIILVIGYISVAKILKPLRQLSTQMSIVEKGDLTVVDTEQLDDQDGDEIFKLTLAFRKMVLHLKEMVEQVIEVSDQVSVFSEELATSGDEVGRVADQVGSAIEDVASGAEEQAAQIEDTANQVETLVEMIQQVEANSSEMSVIADTVMDRLQQGNSSVVETGNQVNIVKESAGKTADVVMTLGNKSQEISEIVQLISSIATQTNLLALNAAIEAARAGEYGRGFSVVAEEIRQLAVESSNATERIGNLIREIQTAVSQAVNQTQQSIEVVDDTTEAITETETVFKTLEEVTQQLYQFVERVTQNAQKMHRSSDQVQETVEAIAAVSEEFSANAEEVAASNEEQLAATDEIVTSANKLNQIADELVRVVNKFTIQ